MMRVLEAVAGQPDGPLPDRVCTAAADLLDAPGVGIALAADGQLLETLSATASGHVGERLQTDLGEGPSYTAHRTGWPVLAGDLSRDVTWTAFGPAASEQGFASVFAFPLRRGSIRSGALTLYRGWPGDLRETQHADALLFARLALDVVLHMQTGSPDSGLDVLLATRTTNTMGIHQASGMVSVQLGITVGQALAVMRAHAYADGRPLRDVATDVVERRLRFDEGDDDAT
jgi:hypothetical protein